MHLRGHHCPELSRDMHVTGKYELYPHHCLLLQLIPAKHAIEVLTELEEATGKLNKTQKKEGPLAYVKDYA